MNDNLLNMEVEHLQSVTELDGLLSANPWSRSMFLEELRLRSFCRVLLDDKKGLVIGYAVSRLLFDEWHVLKVGVRADFRRQGIGGRLVGEVLQKAATGKQRAVLLEVGAANGPALALYEKMGFATLHERAGYYGAQGRAGDAVVMEKTVAHTR